MASEQPPARYPSMRVRPVRIGAEGVTISDTEYVMDRIDMMRLRDMLDDGISRLAHFAIWVPANDETGGGFASTDGRMWCLATDPRLCTTWATESEARAAMLQAPERVRFSGEVRCLG